jgi:hypothetical protein
VRGLVNVLDIVDREADKSSIKEGTVERVSLVGGELTGNIPGFKNDGVTVNGHGKVVVAIVNRLLRRLVHSGVQTAVKELALTVVEREK